MKNVCDKVVVTLSRQNINIVVADMWCRSVDYYVNLHSMCADRTNSVDIAAINDPLKTERVTSIDHNTYREHVPG
jgi:hypothetical protein